MASEPTPITASMKQAISINGEIRCSLTGRVLTAEEAYWAPPLITTRQLLAAIVQTGIRSPQALGQLLFSEQPNVPFAPEVRKTLAARRSAEQLKLLGLLLILAVLIIVPILLLAL